MFVIASTSFQVVSLECQDFRLWLWGNRLARSVTTRLNDTSVAGTAAKKKGAFEVDVQIGSVDLEVVVTHLQYNLISRLKMSTCTTVIYSMRVLVNVLLNVAAWLFRKKKIKNFWLLRRENIQNIYDKSFQDLPFASLEIKSISLGHLN